MVQNILGLKKEIMGTSQSEVIIFILISEFMAPGATGLVLVSDIRVLNNIFENTAHHWLKPNIGNSTFNNSNEQFLVVCMCIKNSMHSFFALPG